MARNTVQHLRSSISSAIPSTSALTDGEIAINLADSRLFIKNSTNGISTFINSSATQTLINNMGNTKLSITGGTISGDLLITSGGSTDGNLIIDYGYLQSNDLQTKALKLYDIGNTASFGTNINLVASGTGDSLYFAFVSGVSNTLVDITAGNIYSNGASLLKEGKTIAAGAALTGGGSLLNSSSGVTLSHSAYGATTYSASSSQYISSITRDAYGHINGASYASLPSGSLSGLSDTSIGAISANQILRWNGTAWVNSNESSLSLVTTAAGTAYGIVTATNHTISARTLTSSDVGAISTARTVTVTSGLTYTGGPLSASNLVIGHALKPTTGGATLTATTNTASTSALTSLALDTYGHIVSGTSIGVNAANGLALLDSSGKIQTINLPDYILGQVVYGGTIAADGLITLSTNGKTKLNTTASTINISSVTISNAEGLYVIATATISFLSASTGDWVISNGTAWTKVDNTDAVTSVNGQIGAVSITTSNISAVPTTRTISYNGPISGSSNLSSNITIGHNSFANNVTSITATSTTFNVVSGVSMDSYGHITAVTKASVTVPEQNLSTYIKQAGTWYILDSDHNGPYYVNDIVYYEGKSFICIQEHSFFNNGSISVYDTSFWRPLYVSTYANLSGIVGTTSTSLARGDHSHPITTGSGITVSGTLSNSGTGITISHLTYPASSLTVNTGSYISSVTRDGLGHLIGVGSAALTTSALSDTTITSVANGQYLMFSSGTNKWINVDLSIDCGIYE